MTGGLWHDGPGAGNLAAMKAPGWLVALNLVFALLFVVSAGLQYNDPDPLRWVVVYLAGAAAAVAALHARGGWRAALALGVAAAVWSAILWADSAPYVSAADFAGKMSEKGGKVEVMREAGGLTIMAAWLLAAGLAGRAIQRRGRA